MKYVQTDTNHSFYIEFTVGDELVVPDDSSVTMTLTGADGIPFSGYNEAAVSPSSGASDVVVDIDYTVNTKDNAFELRTLVINFTYNNQPFSHVTHYVISDRIHIPVDKSDVRKIIGINADEWSDDNIDLVNSYMVLSEKLSEDDIDIDVVFEGGTTKARDLLDLIAHYTALEILPQIELVAYQSEQADNISMRRFENVDFMALRHKIYGQYSVLYSKVIGEDDTNLTYTAIGLGTDPVTGV